MPEKYNFKKEWPKIKKKLLDMSQEAKILAKKGEEELIKFSEKSKLHIDVTSLNLKREKLFYQIGKEYVKAKYPGTKTAKLKKLVDDLEKVKKDEQALKRKIKLAEKKQVNS